MTAEIPIARLAAVEDDLIHRAVLILDGSVVRELPPWALIGGLAVMVRLGQNHRPTGDVDTVSASETLAIQVLRDAGENPKGNRVVLDGVKFEFIDVSEGDPDSGHYLAHRYALDTATEARVTAQTTRGDELASATVNTATAGNGCAPIARNGPGGRSRSDRLPPTSPPDPGYSDRTY